MDKTKHGETWEKVGHKSKFKETARPVPLPVSPKKEKLKNHDEEELRIIESFLDWLASEKGVVLCKWFEGYEDPDIKIPKGFNKVGISPPQLFEEYKSL